MALGTPAAGTTAYSASGGTSVAPGYPAGLVAGDALILIVGQKPSTANGGTVTTPAGWTLRGELTAAGGYGTTLGADVGNTNLRMYSKDAVTGSETGTLSVTLGTNGVSWASMVRVPSGGGTLSYGDADGQRTTTPTSPMTIALTDGASPTNFQTGDVALWAMCIPTDVSTPSQFSAQDVTATGAVFGTPVELGEPDSTTGNDIGGYIAWDNVDSGSSTTAPTVVTNIAGTLTNVRGPVVLLRIHETLAERVGDGAAAESVPDVAAGDGGVLVQGGGAAADAGSDTASASGTVSDPSIAGSGAAAESGVDSSAGVGDVLVQGAGVATETGADTALGAGGVTVQGAGSASESGADVALGMGDVIVQGTGAAIESGADVVVATGGLVAVATGSGSPVESGADAAAGAGAVRVQGAGVAPEAGSDLAAGAGGLIVQGAAAASESGEDAAVAVGFVGAGVPPIAGAGAAAESGQDAVAGYVLPGYVEPGYVGGVSGTVGATFTLTGAQALLLRRLCQLHGLLDPLVVGPAERRAGDLVQTVSESAGTVTLTTVAGHGTFCGQVGTMVEELAALHGLTVPLVVTSVARNAGSVTQNIVSVSGTTTVTRQ
jgi:hypothetical protein